ncbi:MAG TPA: hypothetical protein VIT65_27390 [Microlunatus sp.]
MSLLTDIRDEVEAYAADSIQMAIDDIVADQPNAISPGEQFSFSVIATNAPLVAADGIAFVNVRYHVSVTGAGVQLVVPPANVAIARSGGLVTSPLLVPGALVSSMFVFGITPDGIALGVNDGDAIRGLKGQAGAGLGSATLKAHFHGDPSLAALFPADRTSDNGEATIDVV